MKRYFKKLTTVLLTLIMVTNIGFAQNPNNVTVYVNGQKLETKPGDPPAMIVNDRTLMPFTAFLEAVGCAVSWDESTKTANASKNSTNISVSIGSTTAFVNGESRTLDVPPQIINNRTMIPISFIAVELGYEVKWDGNTYTAYIGDNTVVPPKDQGEKNTIITGTFALQNLQRQNFVVQFNSNMKVDIKNISSNKTGSGTFAVNGTQVTINTTILSGTYTLEEITNNGEKYIMLSNDNDIIALKAISYDSFANAYVS